MKIGDMVEQTFGNILRRGMVIKKSNDVFYMDNDYWTVAWFPHPDIPIRNDSIYTDLAHQKSLKVISSV